MRRVEPRTVVGVILAVALVAGLPSVIGCGGGGGPNPGGGGNQFDTAVPVSQSTTAIQKDLRFGVYWGQRSSRETAARTGAPSSALSFVLTLEDAAWDGSDYVFPNKMSGPDAANRRGNPAAYLEAYTLPGKVRTGATWAWANFYALPNGQGDVVAVAAAPVVLKKNGSGLEDMTTEGTVHAVEVLPGQTIGVGETKTLGCTVRTANGTLLAVTPGSIFWNVVEGEHCLRFDRTEATGLTDGAATVTATVDGIASEPVTVLVGTGGLPLPVTPDFTVEPPSVALPYMVDLGKGGESFIQVTPARWSIKTVQGDENMPHWEPYIDYEPKEPGPRDEPGLRVWAKGLPMPARRGKAVFTLEHAELASELNVDVWVYDPRILVVLDKDGQPAMELSWAGAFDCRFRDDWSRDYGFLAIAQPVPPEKIAKDKNEQDWGVFGSCAVNPGADTPVATDADVEEFMNTNCPALAARNVWSNKPEGSRPLEPPTGAEQIARIQANPDGTEPDDNHPETGEDRRAAIYLPTRAGYEPLGLWVYKLGSTGKGPTGAKAAEQMREEGIFCVRKDLVAPAYAGQEICLRRGATKPESGDPPGGYHKYRHYMLWEITPPPARSTDPAHIAAASFVYRSHEITSVNPQRPSVSDGMNVLAVQLPVLADVFRPETRTKQNYPDYLPRLSGWETPPAETAAIATNLSMVPFVALGDPSLPDARARRTVSPFYGAERVERYKLMLHQINPTSVTQPGVELWLKSGYSETEASEEWKQEGWGISVETGFEVKLSEAVKWTTKVTGSFNQSWGEKSSSSHTELRETNRKFRMDLPPGTAIAIWQKQQAASTWQLRAGPRQWVTGTEYGIDSYVYGQYPPPADLEGALSWVPAGVQVLTPWDGMSPAELASLRPRGDPARMLMEPLDPRPQTRKSVRLQREARRATPPRAVGTPQDQSAFPTRGKGATR